MTKAELVAKLEGVKEFTSVVSIDIVIAALGMLEDPKPATKVNDSFIDEALAQRISEKIERVLDYNTRDIVETDTAEFSLSYDGRTIELDTVEINVSEIMRHVDAVLGEFTAEEEEEGTLTDITE
jgi:hypothetical protein